MSLVTYKILLNRQEEDGRLAIFSRFMSESAYQPGDELEEVFTGQLYVVEPEYILGALFEKFNRGAPNFVGDDLYPQRSLSAGDVVEIDGIRYACERIGWTKLEG